MEHERPFSSKVIEPTVEEVARALAASNDTLWDYDPTNPDDVYLRDARAVLKDEFGVVTTEDARTKLAELKAALDAALSDIDSALSEAGA